MQHGYPLFFDYFKEADHELGHIAHWIEKRTL